ncbi:hypothetical protein JNUCC23_20870 [Peribacillus sp. JNUCC 23]
MYFKGKDGTVLDTYDLFTSVPDILQPEENGYVVTTVNVVGADTENFDKVSLSLDFCND